MKTSKIIQSAGLGLVALATLLPSAVWAGCCLAPTGTANETACFASSSQSECQGFNPAATYVGSGECKQRTNAQGQGEWFCDAQATCTDGKFCPQVPFPGSENLSNATADPKLLADYIVAIFRFGIWSAATLSIFMIMLAGFQWMTAGGDSGRVSQAKDRISNAVIGLVIALFSFVILQMINPQLVELRLPTIPKPTPPAALVSGPAGTNTCCYERRAGAVRQVSLNGGQSCGSLNTDPELTRRYGAGDWIACPEGLKNCCYNEDTPLLGGEDECHFNITQETCRSWGGEWEYLQGDYSICISHDDDCVEEAQGTF